MEEFKWEEATFSIDTPLRWGKLIQKIPMQKRVITDRNELWEYHFDIGQIRWIYIGSIRSEGTITIK